MFLQMMLIGRSKNLKFPLAMFYFALSQLKFYFTKFLQAILGDHILFINRFMYTYLYFIYTLCNSELLVGSQFELYVMYGHSVEFG